MSRWNKYNLIDFIPFGLVQDHFFNKNQLCITSKGDIIYSLNLPVEAYLVKDRDEEIRFKQDKVISFKKHYTIFSTGFSKEFLDANRLQLIPLKILKITFQKKNKLIFYEPIEPLPEGIIGSWLCITKEFINQLDGIYFLHIKNKKVKDIHYNEIGFIKDYIETGAHGILIIELTLKGYVHKEIMVPFIDEFCYFVYVNNTKEIDSLIVKDWEYFLDT